MQPRNSSGYNFQLCLNIEISNQAFKQTRDYNGEIKQKSIRQIQAHSRIFWHILACSEIIQPYSKRCVTPNIFRSLLYSKSETEAYIFRTLSNIYTMERFAKILNSCSCFRKLKLFSQYQLFTFSTFLIKVYFLLQKYLFYIEKVQWSRGRGSVNFDIPTML